MFPKKIKMIFPQDMFVNGQMIAKANEISEIELFNDGSLARWLKRGGQVVAEKVDAKPVVEEKKEVKELPKKVSKKSEE